MKKRVDKRKSNRHEKDNDRHATEDIISKKLCQLGLEASRGECLGQDGV